MRRCPWTFPTLILGLLLFGAGCKNSGGSSDGGNPACLEGERACAEDAVTLMTCTNGQWVEDRSCDQEQNRLCEGGTCVDPWLYGSPEFDPCTDDPHATTMTLAEKAAKYDHLAEVLHIHPEHKRILHVTLAEGYTEENATYENVIRWHTDANDGLWTGLYITSQAFRYAVTREKAALENLRLMMEGMEIGMRITGVSGLFTREYITPGIEGMDCPTDPSAYIPSEDKKDNRWVKVDTDGTLVIYDGDLLQWIRTSHSVPERFAGYCWLDNVSQDEYSGHMLALASVYRLVDDPEIKGKAARLLEEVADHLMRNKMNFVDWDGRITEHGHIRFDPAFTLAFFKPGVVASGREDLRDFYENCLLRKGEPQYDCRNRPLIPRSPYDELLRPAAHWLLYVGRNGCKSNWNNLAMATCSIFTLLLTEHDPELHHLAADVLETELFKHDDHPRELSKQHNAAWSIMYAAMKNLGPDSTGQDLNAIRDAICALREFPESKASPSLHVGEQEFPTDWSCESRFDDEFLTFDPIPVYLRCPAKFAWWANPYEHQDCEADPSFIMQPADYLFPYWMGRYFGYIQESW